MKNLIKIFNLGKFVGLVLTYLPTKSEIMLVFIVKFYTMFLLQRFIY